MNEIVQLSQPKAKIIKICVGLVCVYGWDKELITDRGPVPLYDLVKVYNFEWTARIGMGRWLRRQSR